MINHINKPVLAYKGTLNTGIGSCKITLWDRFLIFILEKQIFYMVTSKD